MTGGNQHPPRDYSAVFDDLPYVALETVRQRLRLPRNRFLDFPYETLQQHRYCAADAVVALAGSPSSEAREAMEAIFGHSITVCPPCLSRPPAPPSAPSPAPVVAEVRGRGLGRTYAPGHRGGGGQGCGVQRSRSMGDAARRYALLRPGMPVQVYLNLVGRGRGRRDLYEWGRDGSIRVEERP